MTVLLQDHVLLQGEGIRRNAWAKELYFPVCPPSKVMVCHLAVNLAIPLQPKRKPDRPVWMHL